MDSVVPSYIPYAPFLSMAFAVNLLQLWDGVGRWIEEQAKEAAASDKALIAEGPSEPSVARELERKNTKHSDTLTRFILWGKYIGAALATLIFIAMIAAPSIDASLPQWAWPWFSVAVGFGAALWIAFIRAWNWITVGRIRKWVNEKTRQAAERQSKERAAANSTVRQRVETIRKSTPLPRPRFRGLVDNLNRSRRAGVTMTFAQVEALIQDRLPSAARESKSWWVRDVRHSVHAAGHAIEDVDLDKQTVSFVRIKPP